MGAIEAQVTEVIGRIRAQLPMRVMRVSIVLRQSAMDVMNKRGPSAPDDVPGWRTHTYRTTFIPRPSDLTARAVSEVFYGPYLEHGTHKKDGSQKMAPRPHVKKIEKHALPQAEAILAEPYV